MPITFNRYKCHMGFPIGWSRFREKWGAYNRPLEVAKNSHMRVPVGNTAFRGRPRAALHLQAL